jgi:hypothetical protein
MFAPVQHKGKDGILDTDRAVEILRHLAGGVDPYSGEVLGPGGPLQHPDTVRALFLAVEVLDTCDPPPIDVAPTEAEVHDRDGAASAASKLRRAYQDRNLPPRAYEPWTDEEDRLVSSEYHSGVRIGRIARDQERTTTAVRSRLKKLGLYGYGPGTVPPIPRD